MSRHKFIVPALVELVVDHPHWWGGGHPTPERVRMGVLQFLKDYRLVSIQVGEPRKAPRGIPSSDEVGS